MQPFIFALEKCVADRGSAFQSDVAPSFCGLSSGRTEEVVFVLLSGVTAGVFSPLSQSDCDCRSVTNPSSVCSSAPAASPAPLLCLWPAPPLSISAAYGSGQLETCSVQLGVAASWAFPSFLHTSSSVPLRWPRPLSRSCP